MNCIYFGEKNFEWPSFKSVVESFDYFCIENYFSNNEEVKCHLFAHTFEGQMIFKDKSEKSFSSDKKVYNNYNYHVEKHNNNNIVCSQ